MYMRTHKAVIVQFLKITYKYILFYFMNEICIQAVDELVVCVPFTSYVYLLLSLGLQQHTSYV